MTGSCVAGTLQGSRFDPSASIRTRSASAIACLIQSGSGIFSFCGCFTSTSPITAQSPAPQIRSRSSGVRASFSGSGRKICVVVVTSTFFPCLVPQAAIPSISELFPPAPTKEKQCLSFVRVENNRCDSTFSLCFFSRLYL